MKEPFPASLSEAAGDYFWLLSRGYPQKASLKLVGDKYMLSRDMRQVLYRGISARDEAEARRDRIGTIRQGDLVLVDTYNVLFTVNNYLLGRPVFISNDGLLRDAGEMRGKILNKPVFGRSARLFLETLGDWKGSRFMLYLDEPVSYSGELSAELTDGMAELGIEGEAKTVNSPDYILRHVAGDVLCTSDTAIIDHSRGKVADLPKYLLEKYFQPEFPLLLM